MATLNSALPVSRAQYYSLKYPLVLLGSVLAFSLLGHIAALAPHHGDAALDYASGVVISLDIGLLVLSLYG